jgi:hypothetical protein
MLSGAQISSMSRSLTAGLSGPGIALITSASRADRRGVSWSPEMRQVAQ